jgi:DNA polymerase-3 subunit alpha
MFIIFDTETTGLPSNYNAPVTDTDNWPRLVQLAWECHDEYGNLTEVKNFLIKPSGFTIPFSAEKIHGISTERALRDGFELTDVLHAFNQALKKSKLAIGHNIDFDRNILGAEYIRTGIRNELATIGHFCTKEEATDFCALPGGKGKKFKWPSLEELYFKLFQENFEEAHNASADVAATARCFFELVRLGVIKPAIAELDQQWYNEFLKKNVNIYPPINLSHLHNREETLLTSEQSGKNAFDLKDYTFTHLHLHTQYSILDGAADIRQVITKAKNDGMVAVAITDHGSMFGVKEFHNEATKHGIKPIIGCEVYVAKRSRFEKSEKGDGGGYHLILLAKNMQGYKNLIKLVSLGWTEGFYYKPRIDKELLKKHHDGLIALTACLKGELPWVLRKEGIEKAREVAKEYKNIFGDDYYFELQRHKSGDPNTDKEVYEDQVYVNNELIALSKEMDVKLVATNDVHFINEEDAVAHDLLLCISTGKDLDDPGRLRYTRQEWMKTQDEMKSLFADIPESIINTGEVVDKIEKFDLNSDPIMPDFTIPEGFADSNEYLRHLTYAGASERYPILDERVRERIEFELEIIKKMGFPGYFLIIWDVIRAAREMGVSVGPGRGSAAGSVVAYCLKITDIDPIKYDLLFERFLNPDRISMPDIDIDFDEDGREKVLEYVVKKYGEKRVAHIITFGTMAPKMAIRDVARVLKLPLPEANRLAKIIPETPGISFKEAYERVPSLIQERHSDNELIAETLKHAEVLEGSVRHTGVHACGIIISKNDLEDHIPICRSKDTNLNVTQYDGSHIESVGMLKMDFLGLKTLSIIKDTLENIKLSRGIEIDINKIPLDDPLTYELYSRGDTTGLFQFESDGMKKYLKVLKPNRFEDLIAMNALYRPGPMDYIPSFINRKHGREHIEYDIPVMEVYLKDTYGITVYQEQVMLLSQLLAGFSKGMADSLRKAMGKKIASMMDQLKIKFIEGCTQNGYDQKIAEKIWRDWESFAHYAFNKSHSTCYAYISYQTAYLKAHFPAEFMAAVLSRNLNDIKKITFFMEECKRMGLTVLVPDINESFLNFTVNANGQIRFGLAAIKGVGESAVSHIIETRKKAGPFKDIYNVVERVNLTIVNKRCLEALAAAGCFDSFINIKRHQYFTTDESGMTFIEQLIRYGNLIQSQAGSSKTLFGDISTFQVVKPKPKDEEEWPPLIKLNKEKDVIGIYLSAHPLDNYKVEIQHFCNITLAELRDLSLHKNKDLIIAGIVTSTKHAYTKTGKPYGTFSLEDYTDTYTFTFFGKDYENFRKYMYDGYSLLIKGTVQENNWKNTPELEFRIKSIHLLNNVRDELINNIQLKLPMDELSEELIEKLKSYTNNGKANTNFRVTVIDNTENIAVDLFSRQKRIELSDDFFNFLIQHPEIEFKLY